MPEVLRASGLRLPFEGTSRRYFEQLEYGCHRGSGMIISLVPPCLTHIGIWSNGQSLTCALADAGARQHVDVGAVAEAGAALGSRAHLDGLRPGHNCAGPAVLPLPFAATFSEGSVFSVSNRRAVCTRYFDSAPGGTQTVRLALPGRPTISCESAGIERKSRQSRDSRDTTL